MDLFSFLLHPILLSVSLCIIFLVIRYKSATARLPLGNQGWPIIGETLAFALGKKSGNPTRFIKERMMKYSPNVFQTSLVGEKVVVFCGPTRNKFLFSNHNYKLVATWKSRSMEKILVEILSPKVEPRGLRSYKYTFALACRLFMSIKDFKHVAKVAHPFHLITSGLVSVPIDFLGVPFNHAKKGGKMLRGLKIANGDSKVQRSKRVSKVE
ncbi:unnamed protein product, partial [Vitis vinifera]